MKQQKIILVILFLIIFSCYAYFIHFIGQESWNATSRLDLTYALAEQGTFRIDAYHQNTGDKVYYKGHYYSDKAPGPSLLAVPFYILLKWTGVGSEKYMRYGLTLLVIGLPSALAALLFYGIIGMLQEIKVWSRVVLTLAYALGTLAFPFSTVFYGHQLAAAFGIASFFILLRVKRGLGREINSTLWLSGLLAGWAFLCDYPTGIILVFLAIYSLLILERKPRILVWLLGAAFPIAFFLYYNYACFGSIFTSSYALHQTYSHQAGFLGITWPKLKVLWGITFSSYRGIFYQSPVLLLAFPGFYFFYRRKEMRLEFFLCLLIVGAFLVFNAGYEYWDGVGSVGARFLIPCLPFLVLPLLSIVEKWPKTVEVLLVVSIIFMLVISATEPRAEWKVHSPLFYFCFFLLFRGCLSDSLGMILGATNWVSLIPLIAFLLILFGLILKLIPNQERIKWSGREVVNSLGILSLVLLWIVIAGWEEPYLREYDKAESLFRYYRGRSYEKWDELERHYRRAIELEPRFREPYLRLAEIARRRENPRLALAYYQELLQMESQSVPLRQEKALVHELLGEIEVAEETLQEAKELAPRDSAVRNQLAEFYWRQKRFQEAIEEWEENLKLNPSDERIRLILEEARERISR